MSITTRVVGDWTVSAVGLGCLQMSFPPMLPKREQAIEAIHCALDLGITLLDTANVYAPRWDAVGHNEALVAEALRTYHGTCDLDSVLVTTKGGLTRRPDETEGRDSTPEGLRRACEESLGRLGISCIELYQHHRHDPSQTYPAQLRAMQALKDDGLIRRIGLSNVNLAELEVAVDLLGGAADGGVVSVQNEYSPRFRANGDVLDRCTDLGVAFLPWSPLGGSEQSLNVASNYAAFAEVGDEIGGSPQETVIAWLLAMSPVTIPIPGATRPETVESIVRATSLTLSNEQFDRLQATVPTNVSMYPDLLARSALTA